MGVDALAQVAMLPAWSRRALQPQHLSHQAGSSRPLVSAAKKTIKVS
eukprot:COSAG05_NODE_11255_length_522_cov_1.425532_1_plen_46_part_10